MEIPARRWGWKCRGKRDAPLGRWQRPRRGKWNSKRGGNASEIGRKRPGKRLHSPPSESIWDAIIASKIPDEFPDGLPHPLPPPPPPSSLLPPSWPPAGFYGWESTQMILKLLRIDNRRGARMADKELTKASDDIKNVILYKHECTWEEMEAEVNNDLSSPSPTFIFSRK